MSFRAKKLNEDSFTGSKKLTLDSFRLGVELSIEQGFLNLNLDHLKIMNNRLQDALENSLRIDCSEREVPSE